VFSCLSKMSSVWLSLLRIVVGPYPELQNRDLNELVYFLQSNTQSLIWCQFGGASVIKLLLICSRVRKNGGEIARIEFLDKNYGKSIVQISNAQLEYRI
jgi:hypothetical protein